MENKREGKKIALYAPYIYPWMTHLSETLSAIEGISESRFFSTGIYGNYPWEDYVSKACSYRRISVFSENIAHPRLFSDFRKYSPDYAIFFAAETLNTALLVKLRKNARVLLVVEENSERSYQGLKRLLALMKSRIVISTYRASPVLLAESSRGRDYLLRLGLPCENVVVMPHGADIERFRPRKKDERMLSMLRIPKDALVVNFMGEFSEYKGGEYIAECALCNAFKDKNVIFIFPNFGPLYDKYATRLSRCPRVRLRGKLSEECILSLYSISDVTVVPSKKMENDSSDRSPNALIEGMCCGNAVVATDVGGIPDIVGDAGILVKPNDAKALEDAIASLLDYNLLTRLKSAARERAEGALDNRKYARALVSLLAGGAGA